jgi:uncharacterized protein YeeX (DUF496 family)
MRELYPDLTFRRQSFICQQVMSSTSISKKRNWLLGRNSELSVHNKLTLYKQVIRPVWSYGIQLWGWTSESNIQVIQRYQNKVLIFIVNAPWYVRNSDDRDLGIETVTDIIVKFAKSYEKRLQDHINIEASRLLNVNNITRWLKRKKRFELVRR